jgi:adenylate cyclase
MHYIWISGSIPYRPASISCETRLADAAIPVTTPSQAGSKFFLDVQSERGDALHFAIEKPSIQIGRSATSDLPLEDAGNRVSRQHAILRVDESGVATIEDLGSRNGTIVNGRKASGAVRLHRGDLIVIGPYRLAFSPRLDDQTAGEDATDDGISVDAGGINIEEVQKSRGLFDIAMSVVGKGDSADTTTLELVHDVSVTLARTYLIAELVEKTIELIFRISSVHRATLMQWSDEKESFQESPVSLRGQDRANYTSVDGLRLPGATSFDRGSLIMSRTILNFVRKENRPFIVHDSRMDARLAGAKSVFMAGIQSAMCSPLSYQGRFLGVLYADNQGTTAAISAGEQRVFTIIAAQAGVALAHIIARTELARRELERAAMRLYVPPQVFDLIEAGDAKLELGGSMQSVTVLFADIRGFTKLSEQMDAPEVVTLLNEFFTVMTDAIFKTGGTLDKFIGDCIMALFGSPIPAEDSPLRAIEAAAEMQRQARELSESRVSAGLNSIHIGIGIHTGQAVVGNIGSTQRMQYTAIGDTVNIAARLVGKAAAGEILVSSATRDALGDRCSAAPLGELELKGRAGKVGVHSVFWDTAPAAREI